jgi:hypothetical protein
MAHKLDPQGASAPRESYLFGKSLKIVGRAKTTASRSHRVRPQSFLRQTSFLSCCASLLFLFSIAVRSNAQVEDSVQLPSHSVDSDSPPIVQQPSGSAYMVTIMQPLRLPEPGPAVPDLPAQVEIPMDRPLRVSLNTPLSTRISKVGEIVSFLLTYSILLGDGLEVPPNTEIVGRVAQVEKPSSFGKPGVLRVDVDRIRLDPAGGAEVHAHVDSAEAQGHARPASEKHRPTDLYSVTLSSVSNAIVGAALGGATGAAVGAGSGTGSAVLIGMEHRGEDVYLEPGMFFSVILDRPVYLNGADVYAAQEKFKRSPKASRPVEPDPSDGSPRLKRRPPPRN